MNHLHEKAFIGLQDMNGTDIHEGDIVVYHLQGNHTMKEYWNPVYKVVFIPPSFTLEHIGGGKCSGSLEFKLKSGGKNTVLEILKNWEKTVDETHPRSKKLLIISFHHSSKSSQVKCRQTHSLQTF